MRLHSAQLRVLKLAGTLTHDDLEAMGREYHARPIAAPVIKRVLAIVRAEDQGGLRYARLTNRANTICRRELADVWDTIVDRTGPTGYPWPRLVSISIVAFAYAETYADLLNLADLAELRRPWYAMTNAKLKRTLAQAETASMASRAVEDGAIDRP